MTDLRRPQVEGEDEGGGNPDGVGAGKEQPALGQVEP